MMGDAANNLVLQYMITWNVDITPEDPYNLPRSRDQVAAYTTLW
jgi:hypothetical protein